MASVFKRSKRKNEPYWIQYKDHLGKRKTAKGFTDKGLTEELAAKLDTESRLRTTGLIDPEQERYAASRQSSIEGHVAAFEESLGDNTGKHVKLTMTRVRRIVAGCGFESLADMEPEAVRSYLRSQRSGDNGIGHRTCNHYLQAFESFCNWCVVTKRLIASPMVGVERLNTATDVRHKRRALSADEIGLLVASARVSGRRIQEFTGEQRARIYTLSYMTGLRKNEIASLTPRSFCLDASPATVTLEAAFSKHRRKDVLPLHPELVAMLREWLKGVGPAEKLFPKLDRRKTWLMVQKDLERAGIPYETPEGIADFHAAGRHTHITELLRNGASLPEAKELARHTDVKMTMRYCHIGINDQAKAVGNLPAPKTSPKPDEAAKPGKDAALQMRCISGGVEGHPVTSDGNGADAKKRLNPCCCKGLGTDRRQSSSAGTMEAAGIEPASRDISMQASTYVVDPICTLVVARPPESTGLPLDPSAAVFNPERRQHRLETIRNYSRQSGLSGEVPQPGLPC